MTDAPTQSPAKKRRWPLWLMLAVLIAGLAATQVQSLRVALLRVLVLNGPDPARGWAEQRLINEGPVGAPVFLELVLRSYWRISKGQELEAIDELENAFVSYESCLEKEPESVLGLLPVLESRIPSGLRSLFYSNVLYCLSKALERSRLNPDELSIEQLTRLAIAIYEHPIPGRLSGFGLNDSSEVLEQALRLGVPLAAFDEVLARQLNSPTYEDKSELLDAIYYALSEHASEFAMPGDSRLTAALIRCVDLGPQSLAVQAVESLLCLNHEDFAASLQILLAIASRPRELLEDLADATDFDGSDFFDESLPENELEPGGESAGSISELGFGPSSSIHFEFFAARDFNQRAFVQGLCQHGEEQSLNFILWSWASLASKNVVPSWDRGMASALSRAQDYQRPAALFVLAHCSPVYEWIREDILRSFESENFNERVAATYASGFAIGSEGERLKTALKAIESSRSEMRRVAILGLWNFSPRARAQLLEAGIRHFCQSSEDWQKAEVKQLVSAVLEDESAATAQARELILGALDRLSPDWIELFAPLFQRHGRPEERRTLVAARWRHFDSKRPSLDFVEALFNDIPENQRQASALDPDSKDFAIEISSLDSPDEDLLTRLEQLALNQRLAQPVTQKVLDTLMSSPFAGISANFLCYLLSHGSDSEAQYALSRLNALADFSDEASEGADEESSEATGMGAQARDSCPERRRVFLEYLLTKLGIQRFQAALLQDRSLVRLLRPSPLLIEGWKTDSELALWLADLLAREALRGSRQLWSELFGAELDQAPELRALVTAQLAKAGGAPETRALIRASLSPEPPAKVTAELLSDPGLLIFDSPDLSKKSRESRLATFLNALTEEPWPRGRQCLSPEEAEDLRRFIRPPEAPVDQIRLCLLARSAPALWTEVALQILNPEYKDRWSPAILQCARTLLARGAFLAKSMDPALFAQFLKSESAIDSWLVLAHRPELAAPLRAELEALGEAGAR